MLIYNNVELDWTVWGNTYLGLIWHHLYFKEGPKIVQICSTTQQLKFIWSIAVWSGIIWLVSWFLNLIDTWYQAASLFENEITYNNSRLHTPVSTSNSARIHKQCFCALLDNEYGLCTHFVTVLFIYVYLLFVFCSWWCTTRLCYQCCHAGCSSVAKGVHGCRCGWKDQPLLPAVAYWRYRVCSMLLYYPVDMSATAIPMPYNITRHHVANCPL